MQKNIQRLIDESIEILNDEALFHRRDVPGDQDDFEPDLRHAPKNSSMSKYDLYESIQAMIEIYDHLDESKITSDISEKIDDVKNAIRELSMCAGKR